MSLRGRNEDRAPDEESNANPRLTAGQSIARHLQSRSFVDILELDREIILHSAQSQRQRLNADSSMLALSNSTSLVHRAKRKSTKPRKTPPALNAVAVRHVLDMQQLVPLSYASITLAQTYMGYVEKSATDGPCLTEALLPFDVADLDAMKPPENLPLFGFIVCITGSIGQINREGLRSLITRAGGCSQRTMGPRVNLLITGSEAGPSKIALARRLLVPCIDFETLCQFILNRIAAHESSKDPLTTDLPTDHPSPSPDPPSLSPNILQKPL